MVASAVAAAPSACAILPGSMLITRKGHQAGISQAMTRHVKMLRWPFALGHEQPSSLLPSVMVAIQGSSAQGRVAEVEEIDGSRLHHV